MISFDRRSFLVGSTAAAALAGCATGKKMPLRPLKPGEKRTLAFIGCGIQQRTALASQFLDPSLNKTLKVVCVCDCDKVRAQNAAKQVNDAYKTNECRVEYDFRRVLEDPNIDAVCIATPDHWHAYIAVEAMKNGKDVYCEKPLTFSVEEARKVIEAQKKYGRIFQTGSMQRSWREFRVAVSLVRGGLIGDVLYVDANYGRAGDKLGGPSHPVRFWDDPAKAATEGAPNPDCDWNMWLGPAKWRPYTDQFAPRGVNHFYPMFWRFDDDIGSGYNGDWGAHHLDIAQWGLDMDEGGPSKIICSSEPHSSNLYHGGRRQYGMKMIFKKPYGDVELYHGPFGVWGTVFYGTDGIVAVNRGKIAVWKGTKNVRPNDTVRAEIANATFSKNNLVAASVGADYGTDATVKKDDRLANALDTLEKKYADIIKKADLYVSTNHVQNFCECVESRKCTITPAEVGGRSSTLCLLCNMSYQYDRGFEWDGKRMTFKSGTCTGGISDKREVYRNGWNIVV